MNVQPIQVTEEGVLIPLEYLADANEFEWELRNGYVLLRPKAKADVSLPDVQKRFPWIGIGRSGNPDSSAEAEDVLAREIDRRSGWTLKSPLDEEDAS